MPRSGSSDPRIKTPISTPISGASDLSRTPPYNREAEQALLGAMMMSRQAVDDAAELVSGEDFYQPNHEVVFNTILALNASGLAAEPIALADELAKRGLLQNVGGAPYLHELLASVSIAANASHYAGIVREQSLRRKVIAAGTRAVQLGYDAHGEADDIADQAEQAIFAATSSSRPETTPLAGELLQETYTWLESPDSGRGVVTGFPDVDQIVGGFQPGNMVIVAARPGMGKSTFAMDIARRAAIVDQVPTLFLSFEMSRHELMLRLLSAQAGVPLKSLQDRQVSEAQWDQVTKAAARLNDVQLWLEDRSGLTPLEIRSKARRLHKQGLGLIIIDYLQLMTSGRRVESRQVEVSEFSRQIKLLAKELEIPVIALSQLNRSAEQRADRRPHMADLRESGSLEQDADLVLLLHREEAYDPQTKRIGEADLEVAKNRHGRTGVATLAFQGGYSRFASMARQS